MVFQLSGVHSLSSSGTRNNEFVGYWLGGSGRLDPAKATLNPAAKLETTKCRTGLRLVCTSTPMSSNHKPSA
jgi:hypothetical protein